MRSQLQSVLVLLAVLSAVAYQSRASSEYPQSGWVRIKQVDDYYRALDAAKFAVARHNKETGDKLEFVRMYRGYISGQYYRIFFQAKVDYDANKYETVVLEKGPKKVREVVYFWKTS